MGISSIILTFNSEAVLPLTLASAARVSDDIHIVDSFSSDRTVEIAKSFGAEVTQRAFENYSSQRNWAIENLNLKYDWELHLDSDERLSDGLVMEVKALSAAFPDGIDGYFISRQTVFLGRPLRHGGLTNWHMRLFRRKAGRVDARRYDQHFHVAGRTRRLQHPLIDDQRNSIAEWVTRHNRWAQAEVDEALARGEARPGVIQGRFAGDPVERKRAWRGLYYRTPALMRAFLLFLYRYVVLLGFLDGKEGLIYYVLQTFWYRFLVDAMIYERQRSGSDPS